MPRKNAQAVEEKREYEQIFRQYLEICNEAIEKNKSKFPYTEIWAARFKKLADDAALHAIVFDDRPKAKFKLRLTKNMKIEITETKTISPDDEWPFNYQYLKRVADNRQKYIDSPAMLEWGWLKTVFGEV